MGSLSPTAMRRAGRFGVPIVTALTAVLVSTQGASAATAKPHPPVPPPCAARPVPGMPQPMVSQSSSPNGSIVVTKPGKPGKPGQITCVICGGMVMPGKTEAHRPGQCVICIVRITTGREHGGSGTVTSSAGDGQGTVGQGRSSGSVTIVQGGGGVVGVGDPAPFCPPIKVSTSQR